MALSPGYGETPLPHDELDALLPEIVEVLDSPITRADVYDVEQGLQEQVFYLHVGADASASRWALINLTPVVVDARPW